MTLVGVSLVPVCMTVQLYLAQAKCKVRNKRARVDVAKGYYEVDIHSFPLHWVGIHPP